MFCSSFGSTHRRTVNNRLDGELQQALGDVPQDVREALRSVPAFEERLMRHTKPLAVAIGIAAAHACSGANVTPQLRNTGV